jgi:type III secretion protein V
MQDATSGSLMAGMAEKTRGLRGASYSDVLLTFGVVAIIALMIWPLPLWLIDALVAVNISVGIGLLLVAIYIPSPVAFPSFPSVLLLSTLFRLSLSIAVTRQILMRADGGHIIETFGTVVAGGNIVVGLVVFLIITVVQFIVVAKGAERVAEVAARFTLDGMPGKQMSIDSDLRSGLMDKDDAKAKRRHLEVESQLHGSLDGAMKFVKGDAIAGIIIIIINLLGGLAIGILQNGMPLNEAVRTYSVLTIGDGLVAQIPALLSAISAGLIVTRTANGDKDKHLGEAITRQIAAQPRVLLVTGFIALGMVAVPGFPKPVFFLLAIVLLGISAFRMRDELPFMKKVLGERPEPSGVDEEQEQSGQFGALEMPAPLLLRVDPTLGATLGRDVLSGRIREVARGLRNEYGVPLPMPSFSVDNQLREGEYTLMASGSRIAWGVVYADRVFVPGAEALDDEPASDCHPRRNGAWKAPATIGEGQGESPEAFMFEHCSIALRRSLAEFMGIQEAARIYQTLSRDFPDLVKETLRAVAPQRITEILKRLVSEDIPIRDSRSIFEAIADAGVREKDIVQLTELVRAALKRQVSDRFAAADRSLEALLVQPELEDRLRQSVRVTNGVPQLAVDPDTAKAVMGSIRASESAAAKRPVVLCSPDVRRHLRTLIETEFPSLPVLSFQELFSDLRIVRVGHITA